MTQRDGIRRVLVLAAGALLAFVGSAAAQKVNTEFDETVDFARFKTFAVRSGDMNSPSPLLNSELTRKRVQSLIEKALIAKGLTKADGPSDLNVFFMLGSRGTTEREVLPTGFRGTRIERVPVTQGNLVINLRDPSTRMLVWRGIASDEKENPADISKKLDDWVRKVVDKYPPKKK